jgi:solute carrier family 6 GABA transporter-like protein 1
LEHQALFFVHTMNAFRRIGRKLAPTADKGSDGRDVWPSRAGFVLASMSGCAGMGNLLRYPSVGE